MNHFYIYKDNKIEYELTYKRVKNVNIRVKNDGKVYVSAPKGTLKIFIEKVIQKNLDKILKLQQKLATNFDVFYLYGKQYSKSDFAFNGDKELKDYLKKEAKKTLPKIFDSVFEKFASFNLKKPKISFRYMTSRWGSCNYVKGKINLNICLVCAPIESIEAVIAHEIAHLVHGNHSKNFYSVLLSVMPDYKIKHRPLKEKNYLI